MYMYKMYNKYIIDSRMFAYYINIVDINLLLLIIILSVYFDFLITFCLYYLLMYSMTAFNVFAYFWHRTHSGMEPFTLCHIWTKTDSF
jgi:hypothetical protein